jgi:hypothetical protein
MDILLLLPPTIVGLQNVSTKIEGEGFVGKFSSFKRVTYV